jgi:hypothetical protein
LIYVTDFVEVRKDGTTVHGSSTGEFKKVMSEARQMWENWFQGRSTLVSFIVRNLDGSHKLTLIMEPK